MSATPRVTVLLPFYNAHETLHQAVESIVDQTFQHWQLLLIDNNADAASKKIANAWVHLDTRIKRIHEPQQGIALALNAGLANVLTRYVARMDADDVSYPERLQKQFDFLEQHDDFGLVACRCAFKSNVENADGYKQFVSWQNEIVTPEQHFINRFIESPVAHPSVMFRYDLVERFGSYSMGDIPEDYELWLRWMEAGVKFYKLEEELLTWQDFDNRLSRNHPNYSTESFFETKMNYLARWLNTLGNEKKIIICGTGKNGRTRAEMLAQRRVRIHAFTDVKQRGVPNEHFIAVEKIGEDRTMFYVNFISKRDVRGEVRKLFIARGLVEGCDFILAA